MVRLVCIMVASSPSVQRARRPGSGAPNVAQRALILVFIGTGLNHHRLDAHRDQFAFWDLVGENWPLQNDSWGHEGPRGPAPHYTTIWFSHGIINPSPLANHYLLLLLRSQLPQILPSLPVFLQSAQLFCNFNKWLHSPAKKPWMPCCKVRHFKAMAVTGTSFLIGLGAQLLFG